MPRSLSSATYIDKNRIASDVVYVMLLKITVRDPNTGLAIEQLHVTNDGQPFDFNGATYDPLPFEVSFDEKAGEEGNATLSIKDIEGTVKAKTNHVGGGVGSSVKMMLVNSKLIARQASEALPSNGYMEVEYDWTVKNATTDDFAVTWTLGLPSFMSDRFPGRTAMRDRCPWKYKDPDTCAYTGPLESCDYSYLGDNGCAAHENTERFGGFPGIASE